MMARTTTCTATRLDGRPCTAPAMRADSSVCFAHDETLQQQRAEAQAKGGRSKSKYARLKRLTPAPLVPVFDELAGVLGELHAGECDPKVAQAMASVARAMVSVIQAGEMEQRLRELEAAQPATGRRSA